MSRKCEATKGNVRQFWELNPLAAGAIPFEPGTVEYFAEHTRLREAEAAPEMVRWAYETHRSSGKRVLDVGCGNGYVTCKFAQAGASVVAVDLTDKGVELTKARLSLAGLEADVRRADAESLPFGDDTFDVVVSFGVLHHTPDTETAISEIHRVLRPGGRFLLMLYHRNSFAYRVLFQIKRLIQPSWRGKAAADQVNAVDGPTNPLGKVYSKSEVRTLLESFSDLEFRSADMFFRWASLIPPPARRMIESRWGWHLFAKASKSSRD